VDRWAKNSTDYESFDSGGDMGSCVAYSSMEKYPASFGCTAIANSFLYDEKKPY
jgi:hypothetical protein